MSEQTTDEVNVRPFHTEERVVEGNLVADPKKISKENSAQTAVVFRVASNYRKWDGTTGTFFYDVMVRGPMADNALATLSKGDPVLVKGYVDGRWYVHKDSADETHSETINAEYLGASMRFAAWERINNNEARGYRSHSNGNRSEETVERPARKTRQVVDDDDDEVEVARPRRSNRRVIDDIGDDLD